jgi:hypothetical protein
MAFEVPCGSGLTIGSALGLLWDLIRAMSLLLMNGLRPQPTIACTSAAPAKTRTVL